MRNKLTSNRGLSKGLPVRVKSKRSSRCRSRGWIASLLSWIVLFAITGDLFAALQTQSMPALDESPRWKTGVEWERQLSSTVSVTYSGVPLREILTKFSRHEGIGLFIDRRIDPSIPISMNEANLTFEQALWKLAEKNKLGVCQLGEIYYMGPPEVAKVLPVLWNEMKTKTDQLRRQQKSKWSKRSVVDWPALSQPAQTLQLIVQSQQSKLRSKAGGAAEISTVNRHLPHDVWPEVRLPAIAVDEQVALLLVGFGLWFERSDDGSEIQIIDFPNLQSGEIAWRGLTDMKKKLPALRKQFSKAQFSTNSKTLIVKGEVADLSEISKWLVAEREPTKGTVQNYSLKTLATRKQILAWVCQRIGRKLEFAPELSRTMDERIELSVVNVGVEELIRKVLEGTDLNYDLDQDRLKIQK